MNAPRLTAATLKLSSCVHIDFEGAYEYQMGKANVALANARSASAVDAFDLLAIRVSAERIARRVRDATERQRVSRSRRWMSVSFKEDNWIKNYNAAVCLKVYA